MTELETVARLHDATTLFHAFIYFAPEAAEEYERLGVSGRSGYFASRTAAMGPLPAEMVIATFYNFSPHLVSGAMDGVWDRVTATQMQNARWRAVARVMDTHVRPVLTDEAITEAVEIADNAVAGLAWAGRPLASGNAAVLGDLARGEFSDHELVRLWHLVTILREWRGDTHIGLLIAEPLDGAECTVVSEALGGRRAAMIRASRAWTDADWNAAIGRLHGRGWLEPDGTITDTGRTARLGIEARTNELSLPLWGPVGSPAAERLAELLAPANAALLHANYFAAIGRPSPTADA